MVRAPRLALLPALLVAAALAGPATAAADDLRLLPQGPAVEDLAATVVASGHAYPAADPLPPRVVVQGRPAGAPGEPPCPDVPGPAGGAVLGDASVGAFGAFSTPSFLRPTDAGRLQLCGWVLSATGVTARAERLLQVREPTHRLAVALVRGRVEVTGTLGARRRVLVDVARGARTCGARFGDLRGGASLGRTAARQAGAVDLSYRAARVGKGTWTACAYVQEALRERRADLVVARTARL